LRTTGIVFCRLADEPAAVVAIEEHDPSAHSSTALRRGERFAKRKAFGGKVMSILAWIVLGGIAGWIGSLLVNKTGEGLFRDILLGIVGAVIGGWVFTALGYTGVTGLNVWSLCVAVVGSVVFLLLWHAIFGARRAV
jgi:uncharacterized membrane protein YeaQ/YmgE (transglycosylase-associated protein family)